MLEMAQGGWISPVWTEEIYYGTASLENSLAVFKKSKHALTKWCSNCPLGIYTKEMKIYVHTNLYMNSHSSFIC